MKRINDRRTADEHESIDAELRGAYERGRREQRALRRSPAAALLLMAGSAAAGAAAVYLALNRGPFPETLWPRSHHAYDRPGEADPILVPGRSAAAPVRAHRRAADAPSNADLRSAGVGADPQPPGPLRP